MEQSKFENFDLMGDDKLEEIINSVVYELNYDVVPAMLERALEDMDPDQFKEMFFSNMKLKIVEELARREGIANPSSKEAWNTVTRKYPPEKLRGIVDKVAEHEFKKIRPESK